MNFSDYLIQVGEGRNVDFTEFTIQPNSLKSLIQYVYPSMEIQSINLTKRCILTSLKEEVEINENQAISYQIEYLNNLKPSVIPPMFYDL